MSGRKPPTEARPQTQFFAAPATRPRSLPLHGGSTLAGISAEKIDGVSIRDVLRSKLAERTKVREEAKARGDEEWDTSQFVQLDREASDH
ncbi:hypothetical protein GGF41_009004, partial [Coemansia sp. RSA 2531]